MLVTEVEEIQQTQTAGPSQVANKGEDGDDEGLTGNLVTLMELMQAFLETAFSSTLTNADRKKWVEHIGVPDCNSIQCPKLDPVIQAIMLNDATMADGYLSCLHQFWLDARTPLMAIIETGE